MIIWHNYGFLFDSVHCLLYMLIKYIVELININVVGAKQDYRRIIGKWAINQLKSQKWNKLFWEKELKAITTKLMYVRTVGNSAKLQSTIRWVQKIY